MAKTTRKTSVKAARLIIFTKNIDKMATFYADALGLKCLEDTSTWKRYDAGGIEVALHSGSPVLGRKAPKLSFYARDVAKKREQLNRQGAKFGKVRIFDKLHMSDGKDPDGNPIQLCNQ